MGTTPAGEPLASVEGWWLAERHRETGVEETVERGEGAAAGWAEVVDDCWSAVRCCRNESPVARRIGAEDVLEEFECRRSTDAGRFWRHRDVHVAMDDLFELGHV